MLYTRKGDDGTTKIFTSGKGERVSKNSCLIEALGSVDELNSFVGLCRAEIKDFKEILREVQQNLFIIQAEIAGSKMSINPKKITAMEKIINDIENALPPVKNFVLPGGTRSSTLLHFARALTRAGERKIIATREKKKIAVSPATLAYLNRLSSLFYALARQANQRAGIKEEYPNYR